MRRRPSRHLVKNPWTQLRRSSSNTHAQDYIVNLSSHTLTNAQRQVLDKGLGFVPAVWDLPDYETSLSRFSRAVRLQDFFLEPDQDEPSPQPKQPPFRPKSVWMPPPAAPDAEAYLQQLEAELGNIRTRPHVDNLTKAHQIALKELQALNIVIRSADKGSCIVLEDKQDYVRNGKSHLCDANIYQEVPGGDPTGSLTTAINEYAAGLKQRGYLSQDMTTFLTTDPTKVRTQQLYFLCKIHKTPRAVRPIVSGTGGPTEKVSQLLDWFAAPHVKLTRSHLADSSHLVRLLETTTFAENVVLATVDVVGLYLHIPHGEGIEAAISHMYSGGREEPPFPPEVARALFAVVLEQNFFEFDGHMYKQRQGTAMGTRVAPSYANLFMDVFERPLIDHPDLAIWRRYIDDIFIVWKGSTESLRPFLESLNKMHPNLRFTFELSSTSVEFMDLRIHKGPRFAEEGRLDISPHFKSTNRFQYLQFSSSHPRSIFSGLAKGEFVRMLHHSSDDKTYHHACTTITTQLLKRGYPWRLLKRARASLPFSSREAALGERTGGNRGRILPFVCQYSDRVPRAALRKPLDVGPPRIKPTLAFTRGRTLANSLVRARLRGVPRPKPDTAAIRISHCPVFGMYSAPCRTAGCGCCAQMSRRQTVYSQDSRTWFKCPQGTSCNSSHCVYLLQCRRCTKHHLYVGQTTRPVKERLSGHRASAGKPGPRPLYVHARGKDHRFTDFVLTILESNIEPTRLLEREKVWIQQLGTTHPSGLNSQYDTH